MTRGCWRHKHAPVPQCSGCRGANSDTAPILTCACSGGFQCSDPDCPGLGGSLGALLAFERARPASHALDRAQASSLAEFTVLWNRALTLRGLSPVDANTALTEGLRALVNMTTEAVNSLEGR